MSKLTPAELARLSTFERRELRDLDAFFYLIEAARDGETIRMVVDLNAEAEK